MRIDEFASLFWLRRRFDSLKCLLISLLHYAPETIMNFPSSQIQTRKPITHQQISAETRVELNHVSFEFPNDQKISKRKKYLKFPHFRSAFFPSPHSLWFISGPLFSTPSFINTRIYSNYLQNYYLNASKLKWIIRNSPSLCLSSQIMLTWRKFLLQFTHFQ